MGVSSLPKTVTRQRRDCDLKPGHSAPESSTLTTRLPNHRFYTANHLNENGGPYCGQGWFSRLIVFSGLPVNIG